MSKFELVKRTFFEDPTRTVLNPTFPRIQPHAQHFREIAPQTTASGDVSGKSVDWVIPKLGHFINLTVLEVEVNVPQPGPGLGDIYMLQPWLASRTVNKVECDYGGGHMQTLRADDLRAHWHLFFNSDQKAMELRAQSGGRKTDSNNGTSGNDDQVEIVGAVGTTTVKVCMDLPMWWSLTTDRSLPISLLDNEVRLKITFAEGASLVATALGAAALPAAITLTNPKLKIMYVDVPAAHITDLSSRESLSYHLSEVQHQTSPMPSGTTTPSIEITAIRGLCHSLCFAIRQNQSLNGSHANQPGQYMADELDINANARNLESFAITANGERISGKVTIDGVYNLTKYKRQFFPAHKELNQENDSTDRAGYNLYVYTWGFDGTRWTPGTGNVNLDALSSVRLEMTLKAPVASGATTDQTIEVMGFMNNVATVSGGNLFKQLF